MGQLKYTNNARGQLNAGITNVATSLTLKAGEGAEFPTLLTGDYFYATLQDATGNLEIVKVTARATDVLTIVRAQDGTAARAFATNDAIGCRVNRALLEESARDAAIQYAVAMS